MVDGPERRGQAAAVDAEGCGRRNSRGGQGLDKGGGRSAISGARAVCGGCMHKGQQHVIVPDATVQTGADFWFCNTLEGGFSVHLFSPGCSAGQRPSFANHSIRCFIVRWRSSISCTAMPSVSWH